jgi:pimeloyl-ACP methyl ester carboxylesterase
MDTIATIESPPPDRIVMLPGGRRVGCGEYGEPAGLPVIALHGTPGSRLMFALADGAARTRGLRIIAPERPGYGCSDFRFVESLAQSAEDVAAVADAYGLDRFAIVGVSGGSPYAVAAAAADPDRITLLALAGPVGPIADLKNSIRISKVHYLLFRVLAGSGLGPRTFFRSLRYLAFNSPDTAYRWLMRRVKPSDREILTQPEVKASLRAAIREGLRPGVEGAVQDLRLYCAPWGLRLADVDVPAIVWQGGDDTIVPPAAAYALSQALPNCRLDVIPAAGHYWVFAQFGLILDAVAAVLRAEATASAGGSAIPE